MPCVLPVIGLKVMSFVQQAGQSRAHAWALNCWYAAGIITLRPDRDGTIAGYEGLAAIESHMGEWIIDYHLPGCPPSADTLWEALIALLRGQPLDLPYSLVKYD